eukprot:evm.model.scf_813.3 EVM.evm.TU.scf_813.3   scf_813:12664-13965(+)
MGSEATGDSDRIRNRLEAWEGGSSSLDSSRLPQLSTDSKLVVKSDRIWHPVEAGKAAVVEELGRNAAQTEQTAACLLVPRTRHAHRQNKKVAMVVKRPLLPRRKRHEGEQRLGVRSRREG